MSHFRNAGNEVVRVVKKYKDPLYEFAGGVAAPRIAKYLEQGQSTPKNKKRKAEGPPPRKKNERISSKFITMARKDTGSTNREAKVGRVKGKGRTIKQVTNSRKTVKVSRKFKKAVSKALETSKKSGKFEGYYVETYAQTGNTTQLVKYLGTDTITFSHAYFHPLRVLDAASVLFHNKAQSLVNPAGLDADNFNWSNVKIKVRKSWVEIRMRNNSQRTYSGHIYEVAPKTAQATQEPIGAWVNGLNDEYQNILGAGQSGETFQPGANINIGNHLVASNLFASPLQCDQFNKWFTVVKTAVVIEPGQCFDMNVKGPTDFTYNYQKFFNNTTFNGIQKMNRYVFFALHTDLVSDIHGSGGRLGINLAVHPTDYLICETRQMYDIEMPEETGFIQNANTIAINQPQDLNDRHRTKYFVNWQGAVTFSNPDRVDVLNPTADIPL